MFHYEHYKHYNTVQHFSVQTDFMLVINALTTSLVLGLEILVRLDPPLDLWTSFISHQLFLYLYIFQIHGFSEISKLNLRQYLPRGPILSFLSVLGPSAHG